MRSDSSPLSSPWLLHRTWNRSGSPVDPLNLARIESAALKQEENHSLWRLRLLPALPFPARIWFTETSGTLKGRWSVGASEVVEIA
jgi:hypothetical protein